MIALAVILVGSNLGQYLMIWKPKISDMKLSYEQHIADLQYQLEIIGPMVNVWGVRDGLNDLFPGRQIAQEDLTMRQMPESFVTQSLVLNPETIIGKYYRIGLLPGTTLSMDMVMEDPMDDTVREYDVVASVMPIGLKVGDYVDFRIVYPLGEDYIVLPRKRVEAIHDKTIKLKLSEMEIHFYQAALVDFFLNSKNGATLYLTKYLEPGIQDAATPYYAVPDNILAIIAADPNIMEKVDALINGAGRKIIDIGKSNVSTEDGSAIASGRNEISGKIDSGKTQFENAEKEAREAEAQAQLQESWSSPVEAAPQSGGGGINSGSATGSSNTGSSSPSSYGTSPAGNPLLEIEKGVVE